MKAKIKEKKTKTKLSLLERMEGFRKELRTFIDVNSEIYGITLDSQLDISPHGLIPKIALIDLLPNEDETKKQKQDSKK